jgi:hypothetical protein
MSGLRHPPPFSLRLTFEERSALERDAGEMALGAYIRSRVFDESRPRRRTRGKRPVKDHKILAQLLGELGKSRLASNLNQLARAVNTGSLAVDPETELMLHEACSDIARIRITLMAALGLYEHPDAP